MDQAPQEEGLPPSLRFLKGLVILLTLTMIVGVITVVGLLVTRMPMSSAQRLPDLPKSITLPQGTTPQAITFGANWTAVVTNDNRILIFAADGQLRQDITVTP